MADIQQKDHNNSKKKRKRKNIILCISLILLILLGVVIGCFIYVYKMYNKMETVKIDEKEIGIQEEVEAKLSKYDPLYNIVLFGLDSTNGEVGRSDSIMILTIDKIHKKLKVTSIMRDSYVNIPKHKKDKINHAYAFGGPQLALRTINENFDLNIKDFVSVDFTNMPKIIDALGGMTLDLTKEEVKYINEHIHHLNVVNHTDVKNITEPGKQHLNGTQVLAYSRIRYTAGGDGERSHRHRIILNNLFELFKNTPSKEYTKLLNKLLPMVKTSLSFSDILDLSYSIITMGNIKLEQYRFPREVNCKDIMINKIYYLDFNKETTVKEMHDYIFEDILPNANDNNSSNNINPHTNTSNPSYNKFKQIPLE